MSDSGRAPERSGEDHLGALEVGLESLRSAPPAEPSRGRCDDEERERAQHHRTVGEALGEG